MTLLEVTAVTAAALALLAAVLFVVSTRPSVVVGPPWAAALVIAALGGGGAVIWFLAQAAPVGSGWVPTVTVAAIAALTTFGGGPLATSALRLTDPRPGIPQSRHAEPEPDPAPGTGADNPPDDDGGDPPAGDPPEDADPGADEAARLLARAASPLGLPVNPGIGDGDPQLAMRASPATPDVLRGGELVGLLERATILALLLVRYPEGIAVVLAVKGLGRFGELRIPAAPERFIVGTLASVLWAVLGFAAIRAVLT